MRTRGGAADNEDSDDEGGEADGGAPEDERVLRPRDNHPCPWPRPTFDSETVSPLDDIAVGYEGKLWGVYEVNINVRIRQDSRRDAIY